MNYKEKLEEAKRLYKFSNDDQRHVLEDLFPELKESEDEKIKNQIISFLEGFEHDHYRSPYFSSWITWLKKQGEQKTNDKVEPKFKVGDKVIGIISGMQYYITKVCDNHYCTESGCIIMFDAQYNFELVEQQLKKIEQKSTDKVEPKFHKGEWITNGDYTWKIVEVKPLDYILQSQDGNIVDDTISYVDEQFHLFTLQDAKDGDVLVSKYNKPFIYNGNRDFCHVGSYCGLSTSDKFIVSTSKCFWTENVSIRPATKEQRDLLFKKMKEAGYEWDSEKKELKKIDTYCQENCKGYQETGKCFADGECKAKKEYIEQKHNEWSEEDEVKRNALIGLVEEIKNQPLKRLEDWDGYISWLKSLKDKVHPKQEWSEEDKKKLNRIYMLLAEAADEHAFSTTCRLIGDNECVELQDFLKSLKPQNHWKPTGAQLASLTIACDRNDRVGFDLTELLKELKKL